MAKTSDTEQNDASAAPLTADDVKTMIAQATRTMADDVKAIVKDAIAQAAPPTIQLDDVAKAWIRREIALNASGVSRAERERDNP